MTETISLDTACALKAAGYPQPELQIGQFWYAMLEEPILCVVVESYCNRYLFLRRLVTDPIWRAEKHLTVYVPGAAELLKALGIKASVSFVNGEFMVFGEGYDVVSDSAAEALAHLWMALKGDGII